MNEETREPLNLDDPADLKLALKERRTQIRNHKPNQEHWIQQLQIHLYNLTGKPTGDRIHRRLASKIAAEEHRQGFLLLALSRPELLLTEEQHLKILYEEAENRLEKDEELRNEAPIDVRLPHKCPSCLLVAETVEDVIEKFALRRIERKKGGKVIGYVRQPQSTCSACRSKAKRLKRLRKATA